MEKNLKKKNVYITESFCCTAEPNTICKSTVILKKEKISEHLGLYSLIYVMLQVQKISKMKVKTFFSF